MRTFDDLSDIQNGEADFFRHGHLPLYSERNLFQLSESAGKNESRVDLYLKLKKIGRLKQVIAPATAKILNPLFDEFVEEMPNFKEVIEYFRLQSILRNRAESPIFGISNPVLLTGSPGIGKTYFARRISEIFCLEFLAIDLATTTASFELTGASSSWTESKPGAIFTQLVFGETINPLILLDEVEKAPNGNFPCHSSLFKLLNPDQSSSFADEFVAPFSVDASKIIYILTANDLASVHPAILDRCVIFNIEAPEPDQAESIAMSVWKRLQKTEPYAQSFNDNLSKELLMALAHHTPRDMKKSLIRAMGKAAMRDSDTLESLDLSEAKPAMRRMGF